MKLAYSGYDRGLEPTEIHLYSLDLIRIEHLILALNNRAVGTVSIAFAMIYSDLGTFCFLKIFFELKVFIILINLSGGI
jgi:hypothetical protein